LQRGAFEVEQMAFISSLHLFPSASA
jgi:hypothetical protein